MTEQALEVIEQESKKVKDDILDSLDSIDTVQDEVGCIAHGRKIRGKTIQEWTQFFGMKIDYNANPVQVNMALADINTKLETAYKNIHNAEFEKTIFKNYYNKELRDIIEAEANRKGRKVPSLETLSKKAEAALGDKTLVKEYYDWELNFWEKIIKKLTEQIRLVNIFSMSNGTRYKIGEPA